MNQLLVHKNNMGREPRDGVTNSNDLCFSTNQELFTKTKRCVILKMPQPLCLHLLLQLKLKKKRSSSSPLGQEEDCSVLLLLLLQLIGKWRNISVGDTAEGCLKDKPKL